MDLALKNVYIGFDKVAADQAVADYHSQGLPAWSVKEEGGVFRVYYIPTATAEEAAEDDAMQAAIQSRKTPQEVDILLEITFISQEDAERLDDFLSQHCNGPAFNYDYYRAPWVSDKSRPPRRSLDFSKRICPTCSCEVAVRVGGELREHRDHSGDLCPASGMTPEQVHEAIDREINFLRARSR